MSEKGRGASDDAPLQSPGDVAPRLEAISSAAVAAAAPYDLIIANILSGPLTQLAPGIRAHLAPGGKALLSGLLRTQELVVLAFYRSLGMRLERRWRLGPWSVLLLTL